MYLGRNRIFFLSSRCKLLHLLKIKIPCESLLLNVFSTFSMFSFIVLKFSLASHFHSTLKVIYLFKKLVLSVSKFSCFSKVHWLCTSIVFVSVFLSLNCGQVTAAEYIFSSLKWLFPFQLTYVQLGSSSKDQNFQNGKTKTKKSTGLSFWTSELPITNIFFGKCVKNQKACALHNRLKLAKSDIISENQQFTIHN